MARPSLVGPGVRGPVAEPWAVVAWSDLISAWRKALGHAHSGRGGQKGLRVSGQEGRACVLLSRQQENLGQAGLSRAYRNFENNLENGLRQAKSALFTVFKALKTGIVPVLPGERERRPAAHR